MFIHNHCLCGGQRLLVKLAPVVKIRIKHAEQLTATRLDMPVAMAIGPWSEAVEISNDHDDAGTHTNIETLV